jgi:hypothetical protein
MLGMCRDPPHRPKQPVKRVAARPPPGRKPAAHLRLAAYTRARITAQAHILPSCLTGRLMPRG